jgi:hypothetical protein
VATFFRTSRVWVIDYRYRGSPRRWLKAWPQDLDGAQAARELLQQLHGPQATLVDVRPATEQEDADYRHGNLPRNAFCPSGKLPLTEPRPPRDGADD